MATKHKAATKQPAHKSAGHNEIKPVKANQLPIEEKFEKLVLILQKHGIHFDAAEEEELGEEVSE